MAPGRPGATPCEDHTGRGQACVIPDERDPWHAHPASRGGLKVRLTAVIEPWFNVQFWSRRLPDLPMWVRSATPLGGLPLVSEQFDESGGEADQGAGAESEQDGPLGTEEQERREGSNGE